MVEQGIDQGPVAVARRRMDDQARGLVDDQQMLVLEDDPQGDVLRLVVRGLGLGHREEEELVPADFLRGIADRPALRFDGAAADQGLQPFARQRRQGRGQRAVEAPAGMGGLQAHVDRLNSPHAIDMGS